MHLMSPEINKLLNTTDTKVHKDWLANASLSQIEEYLRELTTDSLYLHMGLAERERRYFDLLRKPQWTITPTFWIVVASVVISLLALSLSLIVGWSEIRAFFHLP